MCECYGIEVVVLDVEVVCVEVYCVIYEELCCGCIVEVLCEFFCVVV